MATQLTLYKEAMEVLAETKIADLTEDREIKRLLDDVWDDEGIKSVLELGIWNFAIRTVQVSANPSIEPTFGFQNAFDKPSDFVRTAMLSADEFFTAPLESYHMEADHIFCELEVLYWRYVSDDASYGSDMTKWTRAFSRAAAFYFAQRVAPSLTRSRQALKDLDERADEALNTARSLDSMEQPPGRPPLGSWARSRLSGVRRNLSRSADITR